VERGELDLGCGELPGLTRSPLLDTPEASLNQAFAWAVRHDPAGVRADPDTGGSAWDDDAFADLVDQARTFRRVGAGALRDPAGFLHQVVAGLFGVRAETAGGRFEILPWISEDWRAFALRRLRCHRTLLDVEVRVRADWVTVRLELTFGPAIPVLLGLRNRGIPSRVTVDEIPLETERAVFTVEGQHEVVFFCRRRAE